MSHTRRRAPRVAVAAALALCVLSSELVSGPLRASAGASLAPAGRVEILGHGDGPGIGMGQWGDFGYAVRYHLSYAAILGHYYGGTSETTLTALGQSTEPTLSVLIMENLNLKNNVGYDTVVTSPSAYSIESTSATGATTTTSTTTTSTTTTTPGSSTTTTQPVATTTTVPAGSISVPAGEAVDLRLASNGTWNAYEAGSCAAASAATTGTPVATGLLDPVVVPASTDASAPASELLTLCRHDGVDETLRGEIEAFDRQGYERTLNLVGLDEYLDGVVPAEESASWGADGGTAGAPQGEAWGFQALEAQAVAARSYALAYAAAGGWNGYANICDDTYCQAYVGEGFENPLSSLAVADTTGEVLITANTTSVVEARYAASTGGYTAPSAFGAVPDLGDACVVPGVTLECNPVHSWHITVSPRAISRHWPAIGTLVQLRVIRRDHDGAWGGRSLEVVIIGRRARRTVSGAVFASDLSLDSDWFAFRITRIRPRSGSSATTTSTAPSTTTTSTSTTLPTTATSTTSTTTASTAPSTTVP